MSALPPLLGDRRWIGATALVSLAVGQAIAAGVAAFSTRDVFAAFAAGDGAGIPVRALALIASAGLAIAALRYGERIVAERIGQSFAAAIRLTLFSHLTRVPAHQLARRRVGALSMRFVGDLAAARGWVSLGLARLVSAGIVVPATVLVLFLINPHLATAALVPITIGIGLMILAGPRLGPAHQRLRSRRARLAADMSERVAHAPELRLLGRVATEKAQLVKRTEALIASALDRAHGLALLRAIPDVLAGLVAAGVFLAAFVSGAAGAEAAGALAAVGLLMQELRELAGVCDRHRAWVAARDKCNALLAAPRMPEVPRPAETAIPDGPHPLAFDAVEAGVLKGVSIAAGAGRKIALVGGNGSGKSTMLTLAAGLEPPEAGDVTYGGCPPSAFTAEERRRLIAFVGARSPILAGSLRRAFTMGVSDVPPDEEILASATAFGLAAAVERLGGLDGKVAEAGRNLSAGEVRRLLLARAALSAPRLLLLDEPDDALDVDARRLVRRLIDEAAATTVIVTHDIGLAAQMDEIWFLSDGQIEEAGPPDVLLQRSGPLAHYVRTLEAA